MSTMGKSIEGPALACDLQALTPAQRERQRVLLSELAGVCRNVRDLLDGVALGFPRDATLREKLEEWITYERICCAFLTLTLVDNQDSELVWLKATGGPGVKHFLAATLGLRAP